jgi:serine/threonine-protein kinase RIO1
MEEQNDTNMTNTATLEPTKEAVPQLRENDAFKEYRKDDGAYDMDRIFKDMTSERERADGLRRKMSEAKKPKPFGVEDLSIDVPEDEKETMTNLVKSFNEIGISKEQTETIFSKLAEMLPSEEEQQKSLEEVRKSELAKLGSDGEKIINDLRNLQTTMVANKVWDDGHVQAFQEIVSTANAAKMFHTLPENINVIRAGNFSSMSPGRAPTETYSQADQVAMYKKAFDIMRTNKTDGELEVRRLDKLFGMK